MALSKTPSGGLTLAQAREQIQHIYADNPHITISVTASHARVVQDSQVTITGVYQHVFCVEENSCGTPLRHTFQYADLITGRIVIRGQV